MELENILPKDGPTIKEVKKYLKLRDIVNYYH